MKEENKKIIKLSYITGLKDIVSAEIEGKTGFAILGYEKDSIFIEFNNSTFLGSKELKSVSSASLVVRSSAYNPFYISKHKSILGDIVSVVISKNQNDFNSFKISCAGADSSEVRSIASYIEKNFSLEEKNEADLRIHLAKVGNVWEVGVQITPRPLSVRQYRLVNMSGAIDPTLAYAINSLCNLDEMESYLNVFSGSGTLLIEAGQSFPHLNKLVGFDNNKKHLSISIQNIRKSGLIKKIQIKEGDVFSSPDFGRFDVITSDLPFGMVISKNEDLKSLYVAYVKYCEKYLSPSGRMAVFTSRFDILNSVLEKSKFKIIKTVDVEFITSANAYLKSKIMVCGFNNFI